MIRALNQFLFSSPNQTSLDALAFLARVVFALVLFMLFWNSALTKFDGFMKLSSGAYIQIFPRAFDAAGYDASQFPFWRKLIVYFGAIAEFVLPVMIVLGLFTRLASIGMLGFIAVMTLTDVYGHGVELGRWFDSDAQSVIADQRMLWVFLLSGLLVLGGGWLSLDRLFKKNDSLF